jgi:outer membrane immunogenic protein
MKRLLFAIMVAASVPAQALADGAVSWTPGPTLQDTFPSWGGFYVGLHGGMGWGDHRIKAITPTPAFPSGFRHTLVEPTGFVGGSHAGYNWQSGHVVMGFEAEITGSTLLGRSNSSSPIQPGVTIMQEASLAGILSLSGRLGYATGNWLLYGKAGWALGSFTAETITRSATGASVTQAFGDDYRNGLLLGAGAEYRFGPRMSLKAEYNFIDFGSASSNVTEFGAVTGGQRLVRSDEGQTHIVKIGINHRY